MTATRRVLLEAEDILHVIETGRLFRRPLRGAEGAAGEGVAAGGFVREFEALAGGGVDHRVIADDVAAADGVHADFVMGALADDAGAAVAGGFGVIEVADFAEFLTLPAYEMID